MARYAGYPGVCLGASQQMGSLLKAGRQTYCGIASPMVSGNLDCKAAREILWSREFMHAKFRAKRKYLKVDRCHQPVENVRGTRAVNCSKIQSLQLELPEAKQLQECLHHISSAMGLENYSLGQHITASGSQHLMGMEGKWSLTWNMDGRFYEKYEGPELHYEWAFDGENEPWCADAAGRVSTLDLDDREACLLASWVRTGYWLQEKAREHLSVLLEHGKVSGRLDSRRELVFALRLKNSLVVAYVFVDVGTWLPVRLNIKAYGSEDKWEYADWQPFLPGSQSLFPKEITHTPPCGGRDFYSVNSMKVSKLQMKTSNAYDLPQSKLVPRYTQSYPQTYVNDSCPPVVAMIQAESGHSLVRPLIDGKDIGYFIVDTGASSLTIAPHKAAELGMYAFGETHVTGVEGEVKSQFRRAKSLQLGPLTILAPIFMEVPMEGVVRGVSQVAGICGYDIFFNCVVEVSQKMGTLSLFNPLNYISMHYEALAWQTIHLLDNVPHVYATFNDDEGLFLLDTGAGGVDVVFHGRAAERYRLHEVLELAGTASMTGVNSSGKGLQVHYGILKTLKIAGHSFSRVRALFPTKGTGGALNFSEYTAGVLCGDLFENFTVVLDYGQRRCSFINNNFSKGQQLKSRTEG